MTTALPAVVKSLARIVAVSEVGLSNTVARGAPFHCTTDPGTKFDPVTVSIKPGLPAAVEVELRAVAAGVGSNGMRTLTGLEVHAACNGSPLYWDVMV